MFDEVSRMKKILFGNSELVDVINQRFHARMGRLLGKKKKGIRKLFFFFIGKDGKGKELNRNVRKEKRPTVIMYKTFGK